MIVDEKIRYSILKLQDKLYISQYRNSIGTGLIIDLQHFDDSSLLKLNDFIKQELTARNLK